MSFLPEGYEAPATGGGGGYFKPQKGDSKIRILSDAVIGFQYWNVDNKPVRLRDNPTETPSDIRLGDDGKPERVKHFWVLLVWDYKDSSLKVWEITQATIRDKIANLVANPDWGHPKSYNITVKKEGEGKDGTKYDIIPSPGQSLASDVVATWKDAKVNLEAVFESGAAPIGYEGNLPDGAAGSYNESRAVRLLNDMVGRAAGDSELLGKAHKWAMAEKQFTEIDKWAGGDGQAYIESVCCVQAVGAGGAPDYAEIPF